MSGKEFLSFLSKTVGRGWLVILAVSFLSSMLLVTLLAEPWYLGLVFDLLFGLWILWLLKVGLLAFEEDCRRKAKTGESKEVSLEELTIVSISGAELWEDWL